MILYCGIVFFLSNCSLFQYLTDTSHYVKCKCLELIGELLPVGGSCESSAQAMMRHVGDYTRSEEARVRSAAFRTMVRSYFILLHFEEFFSPAALFYEF